MVNKGVVYNPIQWICWTNIRFDKRDIWEMWTPQKKKRNLIYHNHSMPYQQTILFTQQLSSAYGSDTSENESLKWPCRAAAHFLVLSKYSRYIYIYQHNNRHEVSTSLQISVLSAANNIIRFIVVSIEAPQSVSTYSHTHIHTNTHTHTLPNPPRRRF